MKKYFSLFLRVLVFACTLSALFCYVPVFAASSLDNAGSAKHVLLNISGEKVNLRPQPNAGGNALRQCKTGDKFLAESAVVTDESDGSTWYKITTIVEGGKARLFTAYVSSKFARASSLTPELEVYQRYTDALAEAERSLDSDDYKILVGTDTEKGAMWEIDDEESVAMLEDHISWIEERTGWLKKYVVAEMNSAAVREMITDGVDSDFWVNYRMAAWLKRNAKGVEGYYYLKNDAMNGEMWVLEDEKKDIFRVYVVAEETSEERNSGYINSHGELKNGQLTIDFNDDENLDGKLVVSFDGDRAKVTTDKTFKESEKWFSVVLDGEYVREKN